MAFMLQRLITAVLIALLLTGCTGKPRTLLERIQKNGELVILTRNSPTTYYQGPQGPRGVEYELVKKFADSLGVRLRIIVPEHFDDIIPMLVRGEAHMAAAGLTVTSARSKLVRFASGYQTITQQVVYRMGEKRPKSIEDIISGQIEVIAGSSHVDTLENLKRVHPDLKWQESRKLDSEEILNLVLEQLVDYTIADSNELTLNQQYFPKLRVAFDISEPQQLAWAFQYTEDDSLHKAANAFIKQLRDSGILDQVLERYYSHADKLGFVGTRLYLRHTSKRLPKYQPLFEEAAQRYGIDWRLLAAIGYQESHWKPDAKSPTGVRGIMMLTLNTARLLKISNRLDPKQSIMGGARYFNMIRKKISVRIPEPDRTWMALAAYNVGYGHLEDARILAQAEGKDADKWIEVKKILPRLSQKKWYRKTRYGYARGREPVMYVENIRSYYDLLVWADEKGRSYKNTPAINVPVIDSPVL